MDIEALRKRIRSLPPLPPEGQRAYWQAKQADLRDHILEHDPAEFLTWPSITGTMFVGDGDQVRREYADLQAGGCARLLAALPAEGFGAPESQIHPGTSGNLVHQAYHLSRWEAVSGRKIEDLGHIAEAGAGYGALARLAHCLGFRGVYLSFDLPELAALQEFYLDGAQRFYTTSELERFLKLGEFTDLLVGLYSLSEMPLELKDRILGGVQARSYLIAYQEVYDGFDNHAYFQGFAAGLPGLDWTTLACPGFANCRYLIGVER